MRSLLTRLTESIGDTIATNYNRNELLNEKLSLTSDYNLADLDPDKLQDILKANPELWKDIQRELKKNQKTKDALRKKKENKPKPKPSRSSSSSYSGGGCGSSYSSGGCGRSSGYSRSYSGGCGSSHSSGGC
jgi:hypothetical protein